jgi:hypothetical protein
MIATQGTQTGWASRALAAGFVGTVAATLVLAAGYAGAALLGAAPGVPGAWASALVRNPTTALVSNASALALLAHLAVGLALAVVYVAFAEPRLAGPGWRRGMLFALVPWLLSLVVFMPLAGGGLAGLGLGAGPLPMIGSLLAHLAYGGVLGWLYAREAGELAAEDRPSALANLGATRGIAIGVVGGGALGAAAGLALASARPDDATGLAVLAGAAVGATAGSFIGSYLGLTRTAD